MFVLTQFLIRLQREHIDHKRAFDDLTDKENPDCGSESRFSDDILLTEPLTQSVTSISRTYKHALRLGSYHFVVESLFTISLCHG